MSNSNKLNQISNQSSPNPIDKLSKMDNPTKGDHRQNFEMENKSAKVHENQSKNSGQEKAHEKVNKVQDGKKFDRSHDNPEYENHLKFQNHTGQGLPDSDRPVKYGDGDSREPQVKAVKNSISDLEINQKIIVKIIRKIKINAIKIRRQRKIFKKICPKFLLARIWANRIKVSVVFGNC